MLHQRRFLYRFVPYENLSGANVFVLKKRDKLS
ncbi:MAG: hypothetical protein RL013_347 [Bacteroidota bacterium]|jgi:hypothetical protein